MMNTVIKLFSTDYRRVFLKGLRDLSGGLGREGKNWRGLEPGDVLTTCDKTHASQRYLLAAD